MITSETRIQGYIWWIFSSFKLQGKIQDFLVINLSLAVTCKRNCVKYSS